MLEGEGERERGERGMLGGRMCGREGGREEKSEE